MAHSLQHKSKLKPLKEPAVCRFPLSACRRRSDQNDVQLTTHKNQPARGVRCWQQEQMRRWSPSSVGAPSMAHNVGRRCPKCWKYRNYKKNKRKSSGNKLKLQPPNAHRQSGWSRGFGELGELGTDTLGHYAPSVDFGGELQLIAMSVAFLRLLLLLH